MDLDQLVTLGIVIAAGVYIVRRFRGKNKGCCGCTDCTGTVAPRPTSSCQCNERDKGQS